jgi:hypothetical protein
MSTLGIFLLGFLVTGMTLAAVILIGLAEAADPAHSRIEDLSFFEKSVVDRPDEGADVEGASPASHR